jgi:hypothetical protein
LYYRLQQNGVDLEKDLRSYLRTARARELLRTESVRRICERALRSLRTAGMEVIVLKGMAAAEILYPEPSLRHCHDLDLLLTRDQVPAALEVLGGSGFEGSSAPYGTGAGSSWVQHPSGFPIGLHTSLYRIPPWNKGIDEARNSAVPADIAGCQVQVLSWEEMLVHVCCHGITSGSPHSPCWASDAWFLLDREHARLNWEGVLTIARRGNRVTPLLLALEYLDAKLGAPIPAQVLPGLNELSEEEPDLESARAAALMSARGRPLAVLRAAGEAGSAARVAWWLAFPPPTQLRWVEGATDADSVPYLYLKRFARFVLGPLHMPITPKKRPRLGSVEG